MRFWFDTEFYDNGKQIQLISIGIVAADGREYYSEVLHPEELCVTEWLQANVRTRFTGPQKSRAEIATDIMLFVGEKPEFWSYCAAYDWVVLCQIYGRMIDIPEGWPYFCNDLKQIIEGMGNPEIPRQRGLEHHALYDARWHKEVFDHILMLQRTSKSDAKEYLSRRDW